jgi:probable rRNA maturation factor
LEPDTVVQIGPIDAILVVEAGKWPDASVLERLVTNAIEAALAETGAQGSETELGITFTDDSSIATLNGEWRAKEGPTNVLSFPVIDIEPGDPFPPALGDIVIAEETVRREAELDGKSFDDHLTHLVIHGFLHLLGHDHIEDGEAEIMEATETRALARLAISDPYA